MAVSSTQNSTSIQLELTMSSISSSTSSEQCPDPKCGSNCPHLTVTDSRSSSEDEMFNNAFTSELEMDKKACYQYWYREFKENPITMGEESAPTVSRSVETSQDTSQHTGTTDSGDSSRTSDSDQHTSQDDLRAVFDSSSSQSDQVKNVFI